MLNRLLLSSPDCGETRRGTVVQGLQTKPIQAEARLDFPSSWELSGRELRVSVDGFLSDDVRERRKQANRNQLVGRPEELACPIVGFCGDLSRTLLVDRALNCEVKGAPMSPDIALKHIQALTEGSDRIASERLQVVCRVAQGD